MGCGASSLKGEDVDVNAPKPAATRRVNTDFANVDYGQESNQGRRMTEYAPHETVKVKKSHDVSRTSADDAPHSVRPEDGVGPSDPQDRNVGSTGYPHEGPGGAANTNGDMELKPYMTNGEESWDNDQYIRQMHQQQQEASQVNGTSLDPLDPTSATAKSHFADENDPASVQNQQPHSLHPSSAEQDSDGDDSEQPRKKSSWIGDKYSKYHSMKHGKDVVISDEDLKKFTGKDRKELNEWAEGRDGVGGNQAASRVGGDNAFGAGQSWVG